MKRITFLILFSLLVLNIEPGQSAGNYEVIVNMSNSVSSISKAEAANLFLKKTSSWSNGMKAKPVDQVTSSAARQAFSSAVLGKSVSAVKSYWQQQIFSGRSVPPPELAGDAAVVNYVKSNPGAIGYVSPGAGGASVKVLTLTN